MKLLLLFVLAFFISCGNPCKKVTCENGGICIDRNCVCKPGFDDIDCSFKIIPKLIRVTKIDVLKFPLKDSNGFVWDAGNTADIFPAIRSFSGGPFIWNDPLIHLTNADNTTEYSFDIIPSLEFTDLIYVNTIEIDLYDNDGANNTLMGNSTQDIYSSGAHEFPESLVTVHNSTGYQFRVHFEYEW